MHENRSSTGAAQGRRRIGSWQWKAVAWALIAGGIVVVPRGLARGDTYEEGTPELGARFDETGKNVRFRVYSSRASRIDLYLYAEPIGQDEKVHIPLAKEPSTDIWSVTVPVADLGTKGIQGTIYYGYRAWGPNWVFDNNWKPGSAAGFVKDKDVDDQGNRFNPNKLVFDPYAVEISHDPVNPLVPDGTVYASGENHRLQDTGPVAPKGIVLKPRASAH